MKHIYIILSALALSLFNHKGFSQCNSSIGINSGTLVPTAAYQTKTSVNAGNYYIVNVSTCNSYTFTFCQGGGSAGFDTQITITDLSGVPIAGAYNDDFCSVQSHLVWTPTVAGNVRVYITKFSCLNSGGTGATLAYATVASYTNTAEYTILGNASVSGTCTILTPNSTGQKGCTWDVNSTLNFLSPFSYDFLVNLGSSDAGADGMAFVMQNDPKGRCACGNMGGSLGAGGISNSLIVEIDTYLNSEDRDDGMAGVLCSGGTEPDHLDIWTNGVVNPAGAGCPTPAGARVVPNAVKLMSGAADYNIENGLNHILRISWTPGSPGTITARVMNTALTATYGTISYNFTPSTLFGTNTPFFGFTASTGGLSNQQSFCNPQALLPVELINFNATYEYNFIHLTWSTASEHQNKYFEVEHSTDAINWKSFSIIPSKANNGDSKSILNYDTYHIQPENGINYYRLKQIDKNNTFEYSGIKTVNFEKQDREPKVFPNPATNEFNILFGDAELHNITIFNSYGQVILENLNQSDASQRFNTASFANGIYYVLITSSGKEYNFKLYVNNDK